MDKHYIAFVALFFVGVALFVFATDGMAVFITQVFHIAPDTAGKISRGIVLLYGIAWYAFYKSINKK